MSTPPLATGAAGRTPPAAALPVEAVDVVFPLLGAQLPADHGYWLFAAVTAAVPALRGPAAPRPFGIHPVRGLWRPGGWLALQPGRSAVVLRLPPTAVPLCLPLAGRLLRVGPVVVRVGVPYTRALQPAPQLYSRLVTIRGALDPEAFLAAARHQLARLGIAGTPVLLRRQAPWSREGRSPLAGRSPYVRRTLRVRTATVVGYALGVIALDPAASLRLQAWGIGGRRHFGCGVFVPWPAPGA